VKVKYLIPILVLVVIFSFVLIASRRTKKIIKESVKEVEVITEIDLIEPIPERFTDFEKLPEIIEENII